VNRVALLGSAATGAIFASVVPVAAFVLLPPEEYGVFSVPYLLFAFGLSLQLSIVMDAWIRTRIARGVESEWSDYFGALLALSVCVALVGGAVMAAIPLLTDIWWAAAAVFIALIRNGSRYYASATGMRSRVVAADSAGAVAFFLTLALTSHLDSMSAVLIAWFASSAAGMLGLPIPTLRRRSTPGNWLRVHRTSIQPLLIDSLMMDLGAIGTPLLLAPFLGPAQFGIYRGISNVALPARLIVDPLRPIIAGLGTRRIVTPIAFLTVVTGALVLGASCYVILALLPGIDVDLGTLTALSDFAWPCAIYVAASFVGQIYYVVCRSSLGMSRLVLGRVVQTIAAVAAPLLGLIWFGLLGAVWGFAFCTVLTALIWVGYALGGSRASTPPAREMLPEPQIGL
jgi:hypothetical protein